LAMNFAHSFEDGYSGNFRIGKRIFEATKTMLSTQSAGNTSLGSILLLTPLITASSYCYRKNLKIDIENLRIAIKDVLENSSYKDSVNIGKAILLTQPTWLVNVKEFDLNNVSWIKEVRDKKAKPINFMEVAKEFDWIAYEYCSYFEITFNDSYPMLLKMLQKMELSKAALATFIYLMSKRTDSHIYRKFGKDAAEKVRKVASELLANKLSFEQIADKIDKEFEPLGYTAGTTADLLVASLYLLFLIEGSKKYI
ncbi:MAG TPA: triphosphoribosyl-dephospho-CoA synthase, partial [Geobacterales bacterium]|nr:triphosphoribosyl-dephospho-CoA synthase [Geobacterales bacterium]